MRQRETFTFTLNDRYAKLQRNQLDKLQHNIQGRVAEIIEVTENQYTESDAKLGSQILKPLCKLCVISLHINTPEV